MCFSSARILAAFPGSFHHNLQNNSCRVVLYCIVFYFILFYFILFYFILCSGFSGLACFVVFSYPVP